MRRDMKVKYYPLNDLAYGHILKKAVDEAKRLLIMDEFSIYDILEMVEINSFINDYERLNESGKKLLDEIIGCKSKFNSSIGRFFNKINESNIYKIVYSIKGDYDAIISFLNCFMKYKTFDRVSNEEIKRIFDDDLISSTEFIRVEKFIDIYSEFIKKKLLEQVSTAELLLRKYDFKNDDKIFLPDFSDSEKETIIDNYLQSGSPNYNYLMAFDVHIDNGNTYKLSPIQRIKLKEVIEVEREKISNNGTRFGHKFSIIFDENLEDVVLPKIEGDNYVFTFPGKWIDDNLDYPTLLNNFIYLFYYCDGKMNFTGLANIDNEGVFERSLMNKVSSSYSTGFVFRYTEIYNSLTFQAYTQYLKSKHKINIEDIIE